MRFFNILISICFLFSTFSNAMDPAPGEKRCIYVVGSTGAGKSTFLNYIFGEEIFKTGRTTAIVTNDVDQKVLSYTTGASSPPIQLYFHDTPGLNDTNQSRDYRNQIKIFQSLCSNYDSISCIVFVMSGYRIDAQASETMNFYRATLAPLFEMNQILFVRTGLDSDSFEDSIDEEEHLKNTISSLAQRKMIEHHRFNPLHYYWINARSKTPNKHDCDDSNPNNFFRTSLEKRGLLSNDKPLPGHNTYSLLLKNHIIQTISQFQPVDFSGHTFPLPPAFSWARFYFVETALRCFEVVRSVTTKYNKEDGEISTILLNNFLEIKKTIEEIEKLEAVS